MNDAISYYINGSREGYFNVRLDNSILEQDREVRALFLTGYQFGKTIKKDDRPSYDLYRDSYISIMGFKTATEGYSMSSSLLKEKDKKAFEDGYKVGIAHKEGKTSELSNEEYHIYSMAMGFDTKDEGYYIYAHVLDDELKTKFNIGHNVSRICNAIQEKAIKHLNESQFKKYTKGTRK